MFFALSGSLKFVMLKFIDSVVSRKVVITIFAGNLSGFSFFSHCLMVLIRNSYQRLMGERKWNSKIFV